MEKPLPAIQTHNLSKHFGKRIAVKNLNLTIGQGEIFSLLGTNGAGKTTTIKMLSCLLKPNGGGAKVLGMDIGADPLGIKEIIGVSPQETAIARHLNARENLLLMGGVFGLKKAEASRRAEKFSQLMELEDRKDQARKLSGGLQRRLSIAMALMSDPKILFLDEPTLGLDPHARRSVWDYIEKLKREKTILLTTHYLEEADALADRIAIMHEGAVIAEGTSTELKQAHAQGQTLQVMVEHASESLLQQLETKGLTVQYQDQQIELSAPELDIYAIMEVLRSENVAIKGLQMQEPSLDEVFIQLTQSSPPA
jgi:ABC-2 type transport system ATP-binding protein